MELCRCTKPCSKHALEYHFRMKSRPIFSEACRGRPVLQRTPLTHSQPSAQAQDSAASRYPVIEISKTVYAFLTLAASQAKFTPCVASWRYSDKQKPWYGQMFSPKVSLYELGGGRSFQNYQLWAVTETDISGGRFREAQNRDRMCRSPSEGPSAHRKFQPISNTSLSCVSQPSVSLVIHLCKPQPAADSHLNSHFLLTVETQHYWTVAVYFVINKSETASLPSSSPALQQQHLTGPKGSRRVTSCFHFPKHGRKTPKVRPQHHRCKLTADNRNRMDPQVPISTLVQKAGPAGTWSRSPKGGVPAPCCRPSCRPPAELGPHFSVSCSPQPGFGFNEPLCNAA